MPNRWQKKTLDIEILKLINEHKALIGKSITQKIIRNYNPSLKEQQIYTRLAGLVKLQLLNQTTYKITSRKACRKGGTLYSLTPEAVQELKTMGIRAKYQPMKARDLDGLYMHSRILEYIPLQLINGATYKRKHKIQNFGIVDFVYNNWELIAVQRPTDKDYGNILVQQAKIAENNGRKKRLYLCKNRPQMINLIKRFSKEHINTGLFAVFNDIAVITQIIEERAQSEIDQYVARVYGLNRSTYTQYENPKEEIVKVYNLIGYNSRAIRQVKFEHHPSYIGFANNSDMQYFDKRFPRILNRHIPFALGETAELQELYIDKNDPEDEVYIPDIPDHPVKDKWRAAYDMENPEF